MVFPLVTTEVDGADADDLSPGVQPGHHGLLPSSSGSAGSHTLTDSSRQLFGDDHTERPELVAIAQQRATERMATTFDNQHTVLIGDTPKDVEAALTAGVRIIAVASGKNNEAELTQAGAPDLTQTAAIVRLVTDGLQTSTEQPEM